MRDTLHPNRLAAMPRNEAHWNWTEKPNILTLHKRIHRKVGPAKRFDCVRECGRRAMDWALKLGRGYTDDVDDYEPLCRKCHIEQDKHHTKRDPKCYARKRDLKGKFIPF